MHVRVYLSISRKSQEVGRVTLCRDDAGSLWVDLECSELRAQRDSSSPAISQSVSQPIAAIHHPVSAQPSQSPPRSTRSIALSLHSPSPSPESGPVPPGRLPRPRPCPTMSSPPPTLPSHLALLARLELLHQSGILSSSGGSYDAPSYLNEHDAEPLEGVNGGWGGKGAGDEAWREVKEMLRLLGDGLRDGQSCLGHRSRAHERVRFKSPRRSGRVKEDAGRTKGKGGGGRGDELACADEGRAHTPDLSQSPAYFGCHNSTY